MIRVPGRHSPGNLPHARNWAIRSLTLLSKDNAASRSLVTASAGRRRPAAAPARARPEQGPGQGPRIQEVQDDPDRFLIRGTVPAGYWVPRSVQAGQVRLTGPPDPLPDRSEPVVPGLAAMAGAGTEPGDPNPEANT